MALYLVTGGCGFIGSNLVQALAERGERVRIVDDLSTGHEHNVAALCAERPTQVELWRGDLLDTDLIDRALRGVDFVLHHAAVPSVPWSLLRPLDCDRINSHGTLHLLEAVRRQGRVQRVVFAASCAAYGDLLPERPKREDDPVAPQSPYAAAKLAGEHACQVYSHAFGVPTVALRYFNIFGPRQDPRSPYAAVLPNFICKSLAGQAPTIFGDGVQSRDFVYVENVVQANLLACSAPADRVTGRVINIGCGESVTLLEVIDALSELLGRPIVPRHEPARAGEVRHSRADIGRARELLGYSPIVPFRDGLERTLSWYKDQATAAPATRGAAS
jgi:UDP-glucose 4-epimerase